MGNMVLDVCTCMYILFLMFKKKNKNIKKNNESKEVFNCVGNVLNDFTNAYDSKYISPVPVSNRLLAGPGFEYDPQASIMRFNGAEDVDGQCKYECFDKNLFTCETTYTQPIIRVYDNENLHCYTALVKHRVSRRSIKPFILAEVRV